MTGISPPRSGGGRHQLTLQARTTLLMEGVQSVDSFDENEIVLETDEGAMIVRGENLHVKALNLDTATLRVDGLVRSMEYAGAGFAQKGRSFLARLFK